MKRNIIIGVLVFIIIFLIYTVWVVGHRADNFPLNQPINYPIVHDTSVETTNTTPTINAESASFSVPSDWQTYTNESFSIEIRHPKEFTITDLAGGNLLHLDVTNNLHAELKFPIIFNKSPGQPSQNPNEICQKYKSAETSEGKLVTCNSFLLNNINYVVVIQELKTGYGEGIMISGQDGATSFTAIPLISKELEGQYLDTIINIIKTIKIKS